MKKVLGLILCTIIMGGAIITPGVFTATTVYANEHEDMNESHEDSMKIASNMDRFTEDDINNLVDELTKAYPTLTEEYLREGVYKQLNGDYSIEPLNNGITLFNSGWQGITVAQAGAALDTAIALGLGVATGGLSAAIGSFGKHEVQSVIRVAISKFFGSWVLNSVAIDFAMNLLSPGTYIAEQFDKQDKVPNNGRINF